MILRIKCDRCGVTGDSESVRQHHIHEMDLCAKCAIKEDLKSTEGELESLREWLNNTHLKKLRDLEAEATRLRKLLR